MTEDQIVRKYLEDIAAKREEIVQAFIAQHGCLPDECEMVEETVGDANRSSWRIQKRALNPESYDIVGRNLTPVEAQQAMFSDHGFLFYNGGPANKAEFYFGKLIGIKTSRAGHILFQISHKDKDVNGVFFEHCAKMKFYPA